MLRRKSGFVGEIDVHVSFAMVSSDNYFTSRGSTESICSLDLSKAFSELTTINYFQPLWKEIFVKVLLRLFVTVKLDARRS